MPTHLREHTKAGFETQPGIRHDQSIACSFNYLELLGGASGLEEEREELEQPSRLPMKDPCDSLRDQVALTFILTAHGVQDIPKLLEDAKKNLGLVEEVNKILAPWQVLKVAMFQDLRRRGGSGQIPPSKRTN